MRGHYIIMFLCRINKKLSLIITKYSFLSRAMYRCLVAYAFISFHFSEVLWLNTAGQGFGLQYPNISLHAVSRDTSAFPHECLYLMVEGKLIGMLIFSNIVKTVKRTFVPVDKETF